MFGIALFLAVVVTVVVVFFALLGVNAMLRSSKASAAEIKRTEVDANHREAIRLLDAMLVQDEMVPYLNEPHRDRAQELVDEFHN